LPRLWTPEPRSQEDTVTSVGFWFDHVEAIEYVVLTRPPGFPGAADRKEPVEDALKTALRVEEWWTVGERVDVKE